MVEGGQGGGKMCTGSIMVFRNGSPMLEFHRAKKEKETRDLVLPGDVIFRY